MDRLRRSWRLVRASLAVIRAHRSLIVYPVIAWLVGSILGGFLPLALAWARLFDERVDPGFSVRGVVAFAIGYVVLSAVVLFCNVALTAELIARFDGLPRSTPSGWSIARTQLPFVITYGVTTSTFASIAMFVLGLVGRLLGVGSLRTVAAWSGGAFLAVPILVVERVGPRVALERGDALLRASWGDQFLGGFGFFLIKVGVVALVIAAGVLLILLAALTGLIPLVLLSLGVVVLAVGFVLVASSTVTVIYSVVTYRHVTNQPVPGFEALDGASRISDARVDVCEVPEATVPAP